VLCKKTPRTIAKTTNHAARPHRLGCFTFMLDSLRTFYGRL
jgi:hypothetical protein